MVDHHGRGRAHGAKSMTLAPLGEVKTSSRAGPTPPSGIGAALSGWGSHEYREATTQQPSETARLIDHRAARRSIRSESSWTATKLQRWNTSSCGRYARHTTPRGYSLPTEYPCAPSAS